MNKKTILLAIECFENAPMFDNSGSWTKNFRLLGLDDGLRKLGVGVDNRAGRPFPENGGPTFGGEKGVEAVALLFDIHWLIAEDLYTDWPGNTTREQVIANLKRVLAGEQFYFGLEGPDGKLS